MFRTLRPIQLAIDVTVAVVCVLAEVALGLGGFTASYVALAGMAAALAIRRLSPTISLVLAWVTALLQVVSFIGPDVSNLAILPILYASARYGEPVIKWAGLVSAGAGALILSLYISLWMTGILGMATWSPDSLLSLFPRAVVGFLFCFLTALVAFTLSWTLGLLARTWRSAREASIARSAAELASRHAQKSFLVEQERNRIARDMHDIVAHSLAVIIAQSDGARYSKKLDRKAVDGVLATISATARDALGDVRGILGQLRHNEDDSPQPRLSDLPGLLDQLRASGLPVRFDERGEPLLLGAGTHVALYRIVQEALTNALRHGDTARGADLELDWHTDGLELTITNSSNAIESGGEPGHGMIGMAERAALAGGTLTTTQKDGTFVVTARIPAPLAPASQVARHDELLTRAESQ